MSSASTPAPATPKPPTAKRRISCTMRGLVFLGCGGLATLSAVLFGQRELLEVGLLLLLVAVIGLGFLAWRGVALTVVRPQQIQRLFTKQTQQLSLQVSPASNASVSAKTLLVEELLPSSLGAPPSFQISLNQPQTLTYPVHPTRRGRYQLGPLRTMLSDPLGLWELRWSFPGTSTALVAPRIVQLPELALYGRFPVGMRTSTSLWNTDDDVSVREYRYGDSLRRIHWRASARQGELMVRREEQPEQGNATLLLDDSELSHRASPAVSSPVPGQPRLASFEQAISTCASLAVALTTAGFGVSLRTRSGRSVGDVRLDEAGPLLDVLSEIEITPASGRDTLKQLPGFGAAHSSSDGSGVVIAVLGEVDPALLHELSTWPTRGRRALAILMGNALTALEPGQSGQSNSAVAAGTTMSQEQLSNAGWKVLTINHLEELADLWMGITPAGQATETKPRTPNQVAS